MTRRVHLIGTGAIAAQHLAGLRQHEPEAEIHACDRDPERSAAFARAHPEVRIHPDHRALLDQPAGADEIVIVCTPPASHAELAIAALRSGRHVLCEKPLACSRDEAEAMLAAARASDRRLGCCSSRFLAALEATGIKRGLEAGRCGRLYHVVWQHLLPRNRTGLEYQPGSWWFLGREGNGGGVLMDWAPYDLCQIVHLLEPVSVDVVQAWTAQPRTALPEGLDPARVDVEFHGGASLVLSDRAGRRISLDFERSSCSHGPAVERCHVYGEDGGATLRWLPWSEGGCGVDWYRDVEGRLESRTEPADPAPADLPSLHAVPYLRLREAIAHGGPATVIDEHAVFALAILREIYAVAESGRPGRVSLHAAAEETTA